MAARLSLLTLALAGCFSPDLGEGRIVCGANGSCPPDYHCTQGRCYRYGGPGGGGGGGSGGAGGGGGVGGGGAAGMADLSTSPPLDLAGGCTVAACSCSMGATCDYTCSSGAPCDIDCSAKGATCNVTSGAAGTTVNCKGNAGNPPACNVMCTSSCTVDCTNSTACSLQCTMPYKKCQMGTTFICSTTLC